MYIIPNAALNKMIRCIIIDMGAYTHEEMKVLYSFILSHFTEIIVNLLLAIRLSYMYMYVHTLLKI